MAKQSAMSQKTRAAVLKSVCKLRAAHDEALLVLQRARGKTENALYQESQGAVKGMRKVLAIFEGYFEFDEEITAMLDYVDSHELPVHDNAVWTLET